MTCPLDFNPVASSFYTCRFTSSPFSPHILLQNQGWDEGLATSLGNVESLELHVIAQLVPHPAGKKANC